MRNTDYDPPRSRSGHGWRNVGPVERLLTLGAGLGLTMAALQQTGRARRALALTGGAIALRAASGWCPVYAGAGINHADGDTREQLSGPRGVNVRQQIRIRRDVAPVYEFWRRLENLPRLMDHLESVTETSPTRSHWVARGPFGLRVEWDADIINEIPNRLIAWRSVEGSDMVSAGSVNFRETPRGTDVAVTLQYSPPAGKAGAALAWFFGDAPAQQLREGLGRLKQVLEGQLQTPAVPMSEAAASEG
jgi:uncharacterized membrane protein